MLQVAFILLVHIHVYHGHCWCMTMGHNGEAWSRVKHSWETKARVCHVWRMTMAVILGTMMVGLPRSAADKSGSNAGAMRGWRVR